MIHLPLACPMDNAIRLMLVERDDRSRARFAAAIAADPRLLLVDCLASGIRALQRLVLVRPDVLLVGAQLTDLDVVDFVRDARRTLASCEVLAIVSAGDEQAAMESMAAGAAGCVSRSYGGADLVAHLLQLRTGGSPVLPAVARLLLERVRATARPELRAVPRTSGITRREAEVLRMLACGCTYLKASERLGVSLHTVTTHIKNAYRKLGVHSAGAAVMRAVQLRIVGESEAR